MNVWGDVRLGARHRVPVILQTEVAECGLACLAMVAAAHGLDSDLATLRQACSLSMKGVTLADLVRMAEGLNLGARAVRADLAQLSHLARPCVLHWDLNHFVVLVGWRGRDALIHDPARGALRVGPEELSRHYTGVALELQPAAGFKPQRVRRDLRLRRLLGPVRGWSRSLAQIFALALALECFVLLSPFFMQWVVDGALPSADRDLLLTLGLGFGLLVLIQVATAAARSWAVLVLSATLNLQWVLNVFAHLLRLPIAWFEKRHLGDIWSRFGSVQQIQRTLTTSFIEAVLDGVMVLLTLAMMLLYSPRLCAVAVAAVLLYAGWRQALFSRLRNAQEELLVFEARQASHFLESMGGVQAIKLFNAQGERLSRFSSLVVETMNAQMSVRTLDLWVALGHRGIFGLERVVVIGWGAALVMDGALSVGMLFAFLAYQETFAVRVSGLVDKAVELRMLKLQAERLADIALTAPEVVQAAVPAGGHAASQASAAAAVPRAPGPWPVRAPALELRDVRFAYGDGEAEVLCGVSLSVAAGESVAIVGPSGCGKSTLLKIMLGLHVPTSGEVLVDGVPLARLGLAAWRDRLGVVMQEEALFSGSIADNISFFSPQPDWSWLEQCARVAAVHDEIQAMPMAYRTWVGYLGSGLSGGQKQRLLLARALYRRPSFLVLDEATSALDLESERAVNAAVRQLALTRVVVAHRPETIASASRVIALHQGRIAPAPGGPLAGVPAQSPAGVLGFQPSSA